MEKIVGIILGIIISLLFYKILSERCSIMISDKLLKHI